MTFAPRQDKARWSGQEGLQNGHSLIYLSVYLIYEMQYLKF